MEKIIFEDSNERPATNIPNKGFIINFLIKKGVVKTESSANKLMTIVSLVFLVAAIYIIYTNFFYRPNTANSQFLSIQQKTQEYIGQGMKFPEARKKAMEDFRLKNTNTQTN